MGVCSEVEGILEPYDPQFKLWDEARTYRPGEDVPDVGMASTYAVRINAPPGEPARYLTVQEGKLTNLMAHQPVHGRSVFDKWGGFLGVAGQDQLEEPGPNHIEQAMGILEEALPKAREPAPLRETREPTTMLNPDAGPPMLAHKFHVRTDLEIEIPLPWDLTEAEAERVAAFVRTLPIPPRAR